MSLTGHSRAAGKRNGGVRAVSLARAGAILSVSHPSRAGIALAAGHDLVGYHFAEDTAEYTQLFDPRTGLTEHTLTMRLERLDHQSAAALSELINAPDGIVALIETAGDQAFVAGWSQRFRAQYPLRVAASEATTGLKPTDPNGVTITLKCKL